MLITALEKEKKELFEKGIEKGKIEAAQTMFRKGWSILEISEITGLSEKQLLKIKSELK